eukprot:g14882.t1
MGTMESTGNATNKTCECGCGAPVRRRFRPGHDARLKSRLLNQARHGQWAAQVAAVEELNDRGWLYFLPVDELRAVPFRTRTGQRSQHIDEIGVFQVDRAGMLHGHRRCSTLTANSQGATRSGVATDAAVELVPTSPEMRQRARGFDACTECTHEHTRDEMMQARRVWERAVSVPLQDAGRDAQFVA